MASPQKENGYTAIANELLEALIGYNLNGTEMSVVLLVMRKTYGWNKKEDMISLSQFCLHISSSKTSICKAIKNLLLVNILLLVKKTKCPNLANTYALNKDYKSWKLVKKTLLVKKTKSTSKENDTKLVAKSLHTKDIKDNNTKDREDIFLESIKRYPAFRRHGKDVALKRFNKSVTTDKKLEEFKIAFNNYLNSENVKNKFVLRMSKWFEEWQDWIEVENKEPFDWRKHV